MHTQTDKVDVIVVGGGLAGLAAAAFLGRAGRSVALYESRKDTGGRAITQDLNGFRFNFGPHALYNGGEGRKVLEELGIRLEGGPPASGARAMRDGRLYPFPRDAASLLTSPLLRPMARAEALRFLAALPKLDSAAVDATPVRQWLDSYFRYPETRGLFETLVRVGTYANHPDTQSAGAMLRQLAMSFAGVTYPHGGWQVMVDGLEEAARTAGVSIHRHMPVREVLEDGEQVRGVRLADDSTVAAPAVLVAAGPHEAAELLPGAAGAVLRQWAAEAVPITAACLDLGLRRLPRPEVGVVFGIDRPLYFSVHSVNARLAPDGHALVHAAKYQGPGPSDPDAELRELEAWMDEIQPGWRDEVLERRFLPRMTVSNAVVTAAAGGPSGRPGPGVPGLPGLSVAGDWVGPAGMLADASLASARQAAQRILAERSAVEGTPLALAR